ncbi:hypothetical protein F3157_14520 [Virgibacillus dakarensis]|uniref:Uncharacterized protein n=1 Tax=Lentibacillus populi TaxID=1827502 RepID=A0A9W5U0P0_9BACI|nr:MULTISPECIES: hypothetical protein [Bacillaceae]MBT2216831.1 hypothetical protein [Virgibacillus dakarensis]MTW86866.1 hypothetical protein [Virgibacillus dakarensis]GGB54357.1 hypothetical protein GCM10011409_34980 [Lentibacillus populi]
MLEQEDLLARQLQLQAEADAIAEEMHLKQLLATAGTPVKVGSSALGLMVWRDLDITVACSKLNIAAISGIAAQLMSNPQVRDLKFINDTGNWNTDPTYPDGYFLGMTYESKNGNKWELDIWFVDEPDKQPDLQHIRTMPDRLTPATIVSILSIKTVWAARAEYGKQVKSFDIYTAVLDNNVRTPAEFNQWLQSRNNNFY